MEKISYEQSREYAISINKQAGELNDLFNKINSEIENNVGSEDFWKGQDAESYLEKYRSLATVFPDFIQKIEDYATFINATVDAYEAAAKEGSNSAFENLASGGR